ncbi:MAG: glucosaminidase domain-containing protein [Woeseiaceae bacterium]
MTTAVTDFHQFAALRHAANQQDPDPAVLEKVAGQFEALFIDTLMKNMRSSSLGEPLFGQSDQHEMYQEMLDKQFAQEMAGGSGIGLKDMLIRQLGGADRSTKQVEVSKMMPANRVDERPVWSNPKEFVQDIWPHAKAAASKLRVAPEGLLAQAALETGWGKHVMRRPDGTSSFNLFGIKATGNWAGPTAVKPTIEFRGGVPRHEMARFRAYPDVAANFQDYVRVVGSQPRFDGVRDHGTDVGAFADALQDSGYATDPDYAAKISAIMAGKTLKEALAPLKVASSQPITLNRTADDTVAR